MKFYNTRVRRSRKTTALGLCRLIPNRPLYAMHIRDRKRQTQLTVAAAIAVFFDGKKNVFSDSRKVVICVCDEYAATKRVTTFAVIKYNVSDRA